MKQVLILFVLLCILFVNSKACSCSAPVDYCKTMQAFEADLVVLGIKTMNIYHGMQVKVLDVLKGNEIRDTLTVWGDNGLLCRVSTYTFGIGDTLVFALNYCDLAGNWFSNDTLEEVGHYHISVCGVYWLHFSNGMITGPLDDGVNSIALVDFESFHQDCLTTGTANQSESLDIHFFYDPAIQALFLDSEYFILNNLRFAIYDLNGRLVRNGRFDDDANNRSHIDVGGLEHGGYVISVNSERTIYGFRFVRY